MSFQAVQDALGRRRVSHTFLISERDGYVYVSNPKAACSTVKLYLSRCERRDPAFRPKSIHHRASLPHLRPGQLAPARRETIQDGGFLVFSFVRHPIRRVLSAYADKIRGRTPQKAEILAALGLDPADRGQTVSFDAFVGVICDQPPAELNPHWRPQTLNLVPDILRYDFIGRVERFDADLEEVRARLALPDYPVENRNRKAARIEADTLMTRDIEAKLADLYARDCQVFAYDPGAWRR